MKIGYFESAEVSDLGRKRKNNEDACLRLPDQGIFCVADGMGGVAGGDLASEAVVRNLQEVFQPTAPAASATLGNRIALFRAGIKKANDWIKSFAAEKNLGQMGSTVVGLVFDPCNPASAAVLHAGDSRLYRYRDDKLKLLTSDHSAVAALAAKLGRDPASLPTRLHNELLRAVGLNESIELDQSPVEVRNGDLFLICSDGLTRMLPDGAVANILNRGARLAVEGMARALVDNANEAGGNDNITVILVKVGGVSGSPNMIRQEDEDEVMTATSPAGPAEGDTCAPTQALVKQSAMSDATETYEGATRDTDEKPAKEPKVGGAVRRRKAAGLAALAVFVVAGAWFSLIRPQPDRDISGNLTFPSPAEKISQTALKEPHDSLQQQDRGAAIREGIEALLPKRRDSAAQQLDENAQAEQERTYQEALKAAQAALAKQDWHGTVTNADRALILRPGYHEAEQLKQTALTELKYIEKISAARAALDKQEWSSAIKYADKALKLKPHDAEATKLRTQAVELPDNGRAERPFGEGD